MLADSSAVHNQSIVIGGRSGREMHGTQWEEPFSQEFPPLALRLFMSGMEVVRDGGLRSTQERIGVYCG